jgi:hypothetical protein
MAYGRVGAQGWAAIGALMAGAVVVSVLVA